MEEHQKKVITIIAGVLIVIVILVLVLNHFVKDKDDKKTSTPTVTTKFNTEIKALNDYNEFFTVNQIINNYYLSLAGGNLETVYAYLDEEYITKNNITLSNLKNKIKMDYNNVGYTSTEIYYNANSDITYYFINGYLEDNNLDDDSVNYYKDLKYLIIADKKSNKFTVTPLESNSSILNIATNYVLKEVKVKNNLYRIYNTTEERVLQTYLSTFASLLFLDNARAYDMLSDETKRKYTSYSDFKEQVNEIYEAIETKIFSYAKSEETTGRVYRIIDENEKRYTIYESKVMSFKIAY